MVNQPLPHQLTVGRLRQILREVPDEAVVTPVVPPSFPVHPELTLMVNVSAHHDGGPALVLRYAEGPTGVRHDA